MKPPAIQMKRERGQTGSVEIERRGVRARLWPVPEGTIEEARARLEPPPVPVIFLEKEGREVENPNDPAYQHRLALLENRRDLAAVEAIVMWGIELLDGVPEDGRWVKELKLMERRGHLDLSWVDWDDEVDREFVYKRYVFATASDVRAIGQLGGLLPEELNAAEASFRSDP